MKSLIEVGQILLGYLLSCPFRFVAWLYGTIVREVKLGYKNGIDN